MVRVFSDPSSCSPLDPTRDLPNPNSYRYIVGDQLNLPVHIPGRHVWVSQSRGRGAGSRQRLYDRAVVVGPDDDTNRIQVRYSSGSTYRVRPRFLDGILTDAALLDDTTTTTSSCTTGIVLVYPETHDYRRACVLHTGPNEAVCEIGCAKGHTCYKLWETGAQQSRIPLGLDKSPTCIAEARQRFPQCQFQLADIFDPGMDWRSTAAAPQVVAMDLNGTRELPAVLRGMELVQKHWQPRLMVVKSRALYHSIPPMSKGGAS